MANISAFGGVVKLSAAQLETLLNTGSVSDGTTTIIYDPHTLYLTPEPHDPAVLAQRINELSAQAGEITTQVSELGTRIQQTILYTLLYDAATKNVIDGVAYSSGIQPSDETGLVYNLDVSEYDFLEVFFHTNHNITSNTVGGKVFVDLKKQVNNGTYPYEGVTTTSGLYHSFVGAGGSIEDYDKFNVGVSADKQSVRLRSVRIKMDDTDSSFGFENGTFYKIIGGKYGNTN